MTANAQAAESAPTTLPALDATTEVIVARPKFREGKSPRFGEDVWDLSALVEAPDGMAVNQSRFQFAAWFLAERFRLLAKEYVFARINVRPPSSVRKRRSRPAPQTVQSEVRRLAAVCRWLHHAHPSLRFVDLTQETLDALFDAMRASGAETEITLTTAADAIKKLHAYREHLRSDGLTFEPWPGKRAAKIGRRRSSDENSTPRIPERVIEPFLRWSLMYVDVAAPDLLSAQQAKKARQPADGAFKWDRLSSHPVTGKPWRQPIHRGWDLNHEITNLYAACYVVVAYLSGMRHQEILDLRRGCLDPKRGPGGAVIRWRLRGRTRKGKRSYVGATWITVEPVAAAVRVLEQLAPGDLLFESEPHGNTSHARKGAGHWTARLNRLRDHVTALGADHGHDLIPLVGGEPWHFTTGQFRRTLAWHIAAQPGGTVAGMLQYKHVSTLTFEGYAGTSPSGFRQEVEQERMLTQIEGLTEQYRGWRSGNYRPGGPGAPRTVRLFRRVQQEMADFDGAIVDDVRLGIALRDEARRVFPGVLSDCWFEPATAMCLRGTRKDATEPNMPGCKPTQCANSCVGPQHLPRWRHLRAEREQILSTPQMSPLQITVIERDLAECDRIIRQAEGGVADGDE